MARRDTFLPINSRNARSSLAVVRAAERFFSGLPQPPPSWRLLPELYSVVPQPANPARLPSNNIFPRRRLRSSAVISYTTIPLSLNEDCQGGGGGRIDS